MSELLLRNSELVGVNARQRLIDIITVPWNQETDVPWRGEVWREVFRRGAFDGIESHAGRVPANRQHDKATVVGKAISADPYSDLGLVNTLQIARTPLGDETLALAEEDMLSPSAGFYVKEPSDVRLNKRVRLREVVRAFLDHIALVDTPAYAGAQVLAVREEQSGLSVAETPLPETPVLDEVMNSDVLAWAAARLSRA